MRDQYGQDVRDERQRRRWRIVDLAEHAGVSRSEAHRIETGASASLEACLRVGLALGQQPALTLRANSGEKAQRQADPVHSALGEIEASHFRPTGAEVRVDEPYQHYQFAGRADLIAFRRAERALLHVENRTRFPDIQAFAGSWNAKRAYLAAELAERFGIGDTWASVDHVVVALWSAEILRSMRRHAATFAAVCPDPPEAFAMWWSGHLPPAGTRSTLVAFDPLPGRRQSRRRWVGLDAFATAEPRYRGYADALDRLRLARVA